MTYFVFMTVVLLLAIGGYAVGKFLGGQVDRAGQPNPVAVRAGKATKIASIAVGLVLVLIISACGSYAQVENGHVGMLKSFGALQDDPLDAGPHFKEPWATVDEVSVQVETKNYNMSNDGADSIGSAVSSDNQEVFMLVVVEHQLLQEGAVDIYREVGPKFIEKKLDPAVPELTKRVTANYKAIDFAKNRAQIRAEIEALLQNEMRDVGIRVNKVSLKNVDFTPSFSAAIERTVEAEQNARAATEQVKIRQAEALSAEAVAQGEAAASIARAKGEADATTLRARAEANRIRLEGQALRNNPQLLQLRAIEKLNPNVQILQTAPGTTLVQGIPGITPVNP